MGKTAIILGASGLTGRELLMLLLKDDDYSKVIAYGRSPLNVPHSKLEERVMNLFDIKQDVNNFFADVVFCCIGTTSAKTPDFETYVKIDKGIPVDVADLCVENDIPKLFVMSSMGAHPESAIEYSRIKGLMEQEVGERPLDEIYFIEPSIIGGIREEKRLGESIGKFFMTLIDPLMVGPFGRYRVIDPDEIAKAMIQIDRDGYFKQQVESHILHEMSEKYDEFERILEEE